MRRFAPVLLLVLAIAASGCAKEESGGGSGSDSGVRGVVMLGPVCPVEIQGAASASPCADQPMSGTIAVSDASGEVTQAQTDSVGRFEVPLPPGMYTLVAVLESDASPPTAIPQQVEVSQGFFTEVTLQVDTGIR